MRPRCSSLFENYQHLEAWDDPGQLSHFNLLHKFNSNLNAYQNKYKKYINIQQNESKKIIKTVQNPKLPSDKCFLPTINPDQNLISHSLTLSTSKVIVSQEKQFKHQEIFCERTNTLLKQKNLSFDKILQLKFLSKRRKISLNQPKSNQNQRFFPKNRNQQIQDKQNIVLYSPYTETTSKLQNFAKLRYRLKKAANKSKLFHDQKFDPLLERTQKQKQFFGKKYNRTNQLTKGNQKQDHNTKANEFSDQRFYQKNIRDKFTLRR